MTSNMLLGYGNIPLDKLAANYLSLARVQQNSLLLVMTCGIPIYSSIKWHDVFVKYRGIVSGNIDVQFTSHQALST